MLDRTKLSPEALAAADAHPASVLSYGREFLDSQAELEREGFTLEAYVALRLRDDGLLKVQPQALREETDAPKQPNPLVDPQQRFGVGSEDF